MAWTVINSGPYIEMLSEFLLPGKDEDGTYLFELPLGQGAMPFIHLDDFGRYMSWAFSSPHESNGLILGIATAHVSGTDLAEAFTAVTGSKAKYVDASLAEHLKARFARLPKGPHTKVGFQSVKDDDALLQSFGENFTNWWNLYRASGSNKGLITRDYDLLNRILPNRVKSVEEWMRKVNYDATRRSVIKSTARHPPVNENEEQL
jgi:hypothetical protein